MMTSTERLYQNIHEDFLAWCRARKLRVLPSYEQVAAYLQQCLIERGRSTVLIRTSALARLYRERGWAFDIKAAPIQAVVKQARLAQKPNRTKKR